MSRADGYAGQAAVLAADAAADQLGAQRVIVSRQTQYVVIVLREAFDTSYNDAQPKNQAFTMDPDDIKDMKAKLDTKVDTSAWQKATNDLQAAIDAINRDALANIEDYAGIVTDLEETTAVIRSDLRQAVRDMSNHIAATEQALGTVRVASDLAPARGAKTLSDINLGGGQYEGEDAVRLHSPRPLLHQDDEKARHLGRQQEDPVQDDEAEPVGECGSEEPGRLHSPTLPLQRDYEEASLEPATTNMNQTWVDQGFWECSRCKTLNGLDYDSCLSCIMSSGTRVS